MRLTVFAVLAACASAVFAQPFSCTSIPANVPRAYYADDVQSGFARDLDGDGNEDLVTSGSRVTSALYGRGDGSFDAAVALTGVYEPPAVAAADLNGDGREDLVFDGYVVDVALNEGNRRWAMREHVHEVDRNLPRPTLAVADVTRDGHPDIVVLERDEFVTLANRGNATFRELSTRTPWTFESFTVGDLNSDGYADIVASAELDRLFLLRGDGSGTFSSMVEILSRKNASPHIADMTGDGQADLLIVVGGEPLGFYRFAPRELHLYPGPLDGMAGMPYTRILTEDYRPSATADYDHDGSLDLIVAAPQPEHGVRLMLNDGYGRFTAASPAMPAPFASADFNHDGAADLAIARMNHVAIALALPDGTFAIPSFGTPEKSILVGTIELGLDATGELVMFDGSRLHAGFDPAGTGTYSFEELPFDVELPSAARVKNYWTPNEGMLGDAAITAGDVHASPGKELLLASGSSVRTFSRIGAGMWRERPSYSFPAKIEAVAAANFNELDAQDEIAVVTSAGAIEVQRASGETLFSANVARSTNKSGDFGLHVRDVDGDRHLDLLLIDGGAWTFYGTALFSYDVPVPDGRVVVFRGRGNGTFETGRTMISGIHIADFSIGDFNGDGLPDLAFTTLRDTSWLRQPAEVLVAYGTSTSTFGNPRLIASSANDENGAAAHAAADVNADGFDDLVLRSDNVLTYFHGTPDGLVERGRYLGGDIPYIAHRAASRFPRVLFSLHAGELVAVENECAPVKRRGVRH